MSYSIITAVLLVLFFLFGFFIGAKKGANPNAPLIPKKKSQETRSEQLSRNIANYVGDSTNQVPIKEK